MSARAAASETPESGPVRWRALEIAAFSDHPVVLRALDPAGRHHTARATVGSAAAGVGILLLLLLVVAPVVALVVVVVDWFLRPPSPEITIPTTAIIMICTLPLLVAVFVGWYRSDRGRDQLREVQVSLLAGFGVLALVVSLIRSGTEDFPDGVRWSAGIAVPSLFAAVFWIALLRDAARAARGARGSGAPAAPDRPEPAGRGTAVEPLKHVRLAVEKLSDADLAAVRADLRASIDDLERRGVIDGPTAERARAAEPGKLALRMSQGSSPR